MKVIGAKLDTLVRLRNKADYDLFAGEFQTTGDAVKGHASAIEALRLLDDINGDPAKRAAAATEIKAKWP